MLTRGDRSCPPKSTTKTSGPAKRSKAAVRDLIPSAKASESKLDTLVRLLGQPAGATLAELTAATGWQAHSVRGALSGSLKKKGHSIVSQKAEGERRYRIGAS